MLKGIRNAYDGDDERQECAESKRSEGRYL